jgi:hypothetical protein
MNMLPQISLEDGTPDSEKKNVRYLCQTGYSILTVYQLIKISIGLNIKRYTFFYPR